MQIRVNDAGIFDIPPFFMTSMDWLAQVEGGISVSVDRGGNGSGFGVGSI
jgi:hypothetical protein